MSDDSRYEFEKNLCRIAQVSRALGIRIVLATQRPDATVITGLLRANFPTRIAFTVADWRNSNIILDSPGAERLLGCGDMLLSLDGTPVTRLQGLWMDKENALNALDLCKGYLNPAASLFNKERLEASNPYDYTAFTLVSVPALNLRPNEICFSEFDAFVYEQKTKFIRTNAGMGSGSNGTAMGFSVGESKPQDFITLVDTARIYFSNQRIVYIGKNIGGEMQYIDIIDYEVSDMTCKIYSVRQKNVFSFAFFAPNPTAFQSIASFLGFSPDISYISAGLTAYPQELDSTLKALIYLSHSPGLKKVEWRVDEDIFSCIARIKSHIEQ